MSFGGTECQSREERPGSGCEGCQVTGLLGRQSRQQTSSNTAPYRFLSCFLSMSPCSPHLAPTLVTRELSGQISLPKVTTRAATSAGVSYPECSALSTLLVLSPVKMDSAAQILLSSRAVGRV